MGRMKIQISDPYADDDVEQSDTGGISITEIKGSIFDAPKGSILIHACNCMGSWGNGIAQEFSVRYPEAFSIYKIHCAINHALGTCLLIPPEKDDERQHYIACLFTSYGYGRYTDSTEKILRSTESAIMDLVKCIEKHSLENRNMVMCKINSGYFNVPWDSTKSVIESIPSFREMNITCYHS